MKIVLLTMVFPPEPVVTAQATVSLAKELTARGHQVLVITSFPSRPGGKIYPGYKNALFSKEQSPFGFDIVRCLSLPSSQSSFLSRSLENLVFGLSAALYLLFVPGVDRIYSVTWPIFATGLMSLVARFRRTPYILRVADLYPESIISQKRLKPGSWLVRLMRALDVWAAQGAQYIMVLTNHFFQVYTGDRGISPDKVAIVPDWVTDDLDCADDAAVASIRRQFAIPDDAFVAAYGGNIGVAAGVGTFIKAGAQIEDVHILIAGDGSELSACQELARQVAPRRVSFFTPWPKEQTMPFYQAADLLVLPTYGEQSLASIPSKLIRYMLSGRAVIAAGLPGTELADIIESSGCGWLVAPDDPQALAQAVQFARDAGPAERARRGAAGRAYAVQNWSEQTNLSKLVLVIENSTVSHSNAHQINT